MMEDQIKTALDGKLYYLDECNRTRCDKVPVDHIPDHIPKFGYEPVAGVHFNKLVFTLEQDEAIVTLRSQGIAFADIAKSMARGQNSIIDRYTIICAERGIEPLLGRIAPKGLPDEVRQQIMLLRRSGKSWSAIGKELGISQWQASGVFHGWNRKRREAA